MFILFTDVCFNNALICIIFDNVMEHYAVISRLYIYIYIYIYIFYFIFSQKYMYTIQPQ